MCVTTAAAAAVVCHSPTPPTTIKLSKVCRLVAKDGTNNNDNRIALSNTAFISYHKKHVLQLLYIKSNNDVKSSRYFIPFTQHYLPSIDNQFARHTNLN